LLLTAKDHPLFYLGVYMALCVAFVLGGLVLNLIGLVALRRALRKLHSQVSPFFCLTWCPELYQSSFYIQLLRSVMGATSRWLYQTPQGRTLNPLHGRHGSVDHVSFTGLSHVLISPPFSLACCSAKIDGSVSRLITKAARMLASIGGSLVMILTVLPQALLPASLIGLIHLTLSVAYLRCTRELQRMQVSATNRRFPGLIL
jgi:hypothetical protein